jgi:hypothetical protein
MYVTGRGDDGAADIAGHLRELFEYLIPEIGLRTDGQDRAADPVGVMRAVLSASNRIVRSCILQAWP